MLLLLGLPNETLIHIISYVMPDDIENSTRCCRHLYILGLPYLRKHRKLKRTQSYLRLKSYQYDNGMSSVTRELCNIARNPCIAFYRTHLRYEDKASTDHLMNYGIDTNEIYIGDNKTCDSICENVTRSVYIDTDHRQVWYNSILAGEQNPAFALLLTLLPNLRKLELNCNSFRSISTTLLDNVAVMSLDCKGNHPLSKLLEVTLEGTLGGTAREDGAHIGTLALFAQLPSVRVLHGLMLDGGGFEEALWPAGVSQVTEIDIAYSSIDGLCFLHFLRGFGNLRSFKLTVNEEESLGWDPNAVREALLMYAHGTLELLDISIENSDLEMEDHFFGSLVDFDVLSIIRIDFGLFVEPRICKTKRLVDMLPASVKSLTLRQERDFDEELDLFAGLDELKHKRLPCLEEIIIYADQIEKHEISCCENLGISINFMGPIGTDWSQRGM